MRLARKARPVAVAKAPKSVANDDSVSPVFGSCLASVWSLGDILSELEALATDVGDESLALIDTLWDAEILALVEALCDADVLADS